MAGRWGVKSVVKATGSTLKVQLKLESLSTVEEDGIRGVAVKCVDIRRKSGGEGGVLDCN